MSKIYTIRNGESEKEQIPSIEYINELMKMIEDAIMSVNDDFNGFSSIKTANKELSVNQKQRHKIMANEVKTDPQHKFINDGMLATIADKPSKFEVEQMLDEHKKQIEENINQVYTRIINTPNVINKLRDISTILNEDEIANGLLNTLSYKLNTQDFNEHATSYKHIDNNDRKALNALLKCLLCGFADWNADEDECNAIRNKPESLPANGGNADTICNHGIKDLINKYDYDIVIGRDGEKYSKDSCDIYAKNGEVNVDAFVPLLKSLVNDGNVLFKRGLFIVDLINNYGITIIFEGIDRRLSTIKANKFIDITDCVFKHIGFTDSIIYIGSGCEMTDINFTNCEIIFNDAENCNIMGCTFYNCKFEFKGNVINNIIKFNRYVQTKPIAYIGGNNIISENI
jgi:hypothetical protein